MANISKYLVRLVGSKLGAMSRSALNENQMSEKQGQSATGGSTALQAAGDIIVTNNTGLTLVEARQVAIDVFNANFLRLADEAASIAGARAESLREKFFDRVTQENPGGWSKQEIQASSTLSTQRRKSRQGLVTQISATCWLTCL